MIHHYRQFLEESVREISTRRFVEYEYYYEQVLKSACRTKGFAEATGKKRYLEFLLKGYGIKDWNPACSMPARMLMGDLLACKLLELTRTRLKENGQRIFHLTVAFPEDLTGDRNVNISWPRIKKKIASMMRPISPNFIGVGEIDITINENNVDGGIHNGRSLAPHFHVVFWTAEPIQPDKLGVSLSSKFGGKADGMQVVKIRKCGDTDADIVRLASYLFKAPGGGKVKWLNKLRNEEGDLLGVQETRFNSKKSHRSIVFSRVAEILSHSDIRDVIISGRDGLAIKNQMLKVLQETTNLFACSAPTKFGHDRTVEFWKMMRKEGWGRKYPTPVVESRVRAPQTTGLLGAE